MHTPGPINELQLSAMTLFLSSFILLFSSPLLPSTSVFLSVISALPSFYFFRDSPVAGRLMRCQTSCAVIVWEGGQLSARMSIFICQMAQGSSALYRRQCAVAPLLSPHPQPQNLMSGGPGDEVWLLWGRSYSPTGSPWWDCTSQSTDG